MLTLKKRKLTLKKVTLASLNAPLPSKGAIYDYGTYGSDCITFPGCPITVENCPPPSHECTVGPECDPPPPSDTCTAPPGC